MYTIMLLSVNDKVTAPMLPETDKVRVRRVDAAHAEEIRQADAVLIDSEASQSNEIVTTLAALRSHAPDTVVFVRGPQLPAAVRRTYNLSSVFPVSLDPSWLISIVVDFLDQHTPARQTLDFIQEVNRQANITIEHDQLIAGLLERIQQLVACDAVNIGLFREQYAIVKYAYGYSHLAANTMSQMRMNLNLPNFKKMFANPEPQIINDTYHSDDWLVLEPHQEVRAWLGMPIIRNGVPIGILNLDSQTTGYFQPHHVETLRPLIPHISLLLEMTQLYETLNEYTVLLSVLNRQNTLLFANFSDYQNLSEMCRYIAETVVSTFHKADCGVMLINDTGDALIRYARAGDFTVRAAGTLALDGDGLVPAAVRSGKMIYAPDVQADGRYIANEPKTRSEIVIPLKTHNEIIGVLDLQHTDLNAFSILDQEGLMAFAEYAALAIQSLRMHERQHNYTTDLENRVAERTAELESAKERVEVILNNTSEAIVLLHENGHIEHGNLAFGKLIDLPEIDYFDNLLSQYIHEDDRDLFLDSFAWVLEKLQSHTLEAQFQRPDGHETRAEITLAPASTSTGQGHIVICTLRDVSRHHAIEQTLRRNLASERELSRTKTHFIRTVHHQFLTPLATILSSSELLRIYIEQEQDKLPPARIEAMQTHFDKILRHIRQMENMLTEIQFMSRIGSDTLDFNPKPTDLQALMQILVQTADKKYDTHQITLHVQGEATEKDLDAKLIEEAVRQMLSNAVKFSPEADTVRVDLVLTKDELRIHVTDYGVGIPENELNQVFDPFFRGRQVDTTQGMGLGLSILKQTAKLHRGDVTVTSTPGQSTTFTLILPNRWARAGN